MSYPLLAEMKPWFLLIPLVIAVFAAFEIRSGVVRFGRHLEFERDSSPAPYWLLVIGKFALVIFLIFAYFRKHGT